jgi:DNA-binding MarR family transcriptional regulator
MANGRGLGGGDCYYIDKPSKQDYRKYLFTMSDNELSTTLSEWSAAFMRRSMHDFLHFARQSGLSMVQMNVLTHIYYRGECEITALLDILEVSKAAAGQLVERMEQQGLVERKPDPRDHRARLVSLTEKGRELVHLSIAARQNWMNELVAGVSPEKRAAIIAVLQALTRAAENLEK